jgi:2-dehydropantoate 2-reductase
VRCAGATGEIGPCDLVLIAIKATANSALDTLIPPLLHNNTVLLTLQNGLGNEEYLAERFGGARVMGGLCFTCINKTGPGKIVHLGEGRISIGEMKGRAVELTRRIRDIFRESDIECEAKDDLPRERWKKLVWNIPFNGLSIAEGGIDVGRILANPNLEQKVRALMRETLDAAAKLGHHLPDSLIEKQIAVSLAMKDYKPSSLLDFLAGRDVEVDAIWGEPLRRAKAAGAEVPVLEELHRRLLELCSTVR